jgi:hypothetical protein
MTITIRRPETSTDSSSRYGWTFWLGVVVGALMMGYGVLLLIQGPIQAWPAANAQLVSPESAQLGTVRRFTIILLLHDLVLVPVVIGFAALAMQLVPDGWRAPVRFALFVSAFVLLLAAWGMAAQAIEVQPGNTHVLPNHYPTSVALLLTPVWLIALVWGWRARRRTAP